MSMNRDGNNRSMTVNRFAEDVAAGLSASPKHLPCKYLYDDKGSKLFKQIMDLEEYYPTRCEMEIIGRHAPDLAEILRDSPFNLVELGAGDGRKTKVLLRHFCEYCLDLCYVPIDICRSAIADLTEELKSDLPEIAVDGLPMEYFDGIRWVARSTTERNLILFLGSNIGNFAPAEADLFLSGLRKAMKAGDLLFIGFDLKKEATSLIRAYNDSKGVTAEFNLNMLRRINEELGADFDTAQFQYYSTYDPRAAVVESFLVSRVRQKIYVKGCDSTFALAPWEAIQTESSYKFDLDDLPRLAFGNGFAPVATFTDSAGYFADALWRAC